MKRIAILYFSGSGHTQLMAEAVQRGARISASVEVELLPIDGRDILGGRYENKTILEKLNGADAIIFGTPTYMGGVAAQFKAFADATSGIWFRQEWKNKLAAAFTHSGSPSGDKLSTLQYLSVFAAQHGMIWIGNGEFASHYLGKTDGINRLGSSLGVMGYGSQAPGTAPEIHPGDLLTAEALGRRVATFAAQLSVNALAV